MRGIRFVTDEQGHRVAVLLDLELWNDIYDNILASSRNEEPRTSLTDVESALRSDNLLS